MVLSFATIFFIISLIFGFSFARFLPIRWHRPEILAVAVSIGLFFSTWVAFVAILFTGYRLGPTLWLVIVICCTLLLHKLRFRSQADEHHSSKSDVMWWVVGTSVTVWVLGSLFISHMLYPSDGGHLSGGSTWGDLALHLSLITRFAKQEYFSWDLPIYSGARLYYPFLIDFLSGLLYRWGWSLQWSLIVPGFLLAFSFVELTFFLALRMLESLLPGLLTAFLFLSNGGPAGLYYFWQDWRSGQMSFVSFLGSMTKQYAHLADYNIQFSNILADYLLPQRTILFGLALFVLILWSLSRTA